MKKKYIIILMIIVVNSLLGDDRIDLGISYNKFAFGYHFYNKKLPVETKVLIGISNQDLNTKFDDVYFNIQLKRNLKTFRKSSLYGSICPGIYFGNNDYYNIHLFSIGFDMGYEFIFSDKHTIFIESGYRYGKKEFVEKYNNEMISISTMETLGLMPFNFVIGYGFTL